MLSDEDSQVAYVKKKRDQDLRLLSQVKYEDMDSIVSYVNDNSFTWKAEVNPRFAGLTLAEINGRGGSQVKLLTPMERMVQKTNHLSQSESDMSSFSNNE